ncbi:protein MAINTENANCE OF MERISTEMS-like [Quercus lobata]|uniref:protein MAINTENANCE OF MERISTEMS-like n=1 Tax=Quercus lobata TaxID=97700 RepID=UPI001246E75A|nr:protein MAINTENANCE OF MERISTEMS-like [Quercus lobata]
MDPHGAIQTLCTRQDKHRSSLLLDAHLEGEEVPGVLTCRNRDKGLLQGGVDGLDPRILAYITDAGLDGLLRVPRMDIDHALITALVERWRPETHSFHLPHGEMTITLQDMEVIMGVPVDGLPLVESIPSTGSWRDVCRRLLGCIPPPHRELRNNKKNTGVLEGASIKAKWLEDQFRDPLPVDAPEALVQKYARFYILELLGGTLFMDKSGERISVRYLQYFDPISNGKKYSWGSAALSWLYRHLCKASEKTAKQIGGALLLVQLWAWARFPHICPVMRHPHQALPPGPLAVRWKGAKITTEHSMHVLHAYRVSLTSLRPNQIVWEPYRNYLRSLPAYCTAGQRIWRSIVPLIHFWVVEGHHPERVLRQFGMKQGIPEDVDTSIELHKITLQGKHEKDWAQIHAPHIAKWAAHARIADAPAFHGEMNYNDEYLVWFRPRTIRHITKETSYWDILVESQLRIITKCEPESEIYTDCINTLEAVEEIGRLSLDRARYVGNTSEPAVRRGRQTGGRQGRGGCQSSQRHTSSRPPTSGQRHTPVPTSSRRPTSAQRPTSGSRHTPVPTSSRRHTPVPTSSRRHTPVPTSTRCHTPVHDHTMEEASQTTDEMWDDTAYDVGSMAHDDAGPSHTFAHRDTFGSPSMRSDGTCPPTSPSISPLPTTRTSPPLTAGPAPAVVHGRDEMRFMPTPRQPTPVAVPPEFVHTEFIQTQIPNPPPEPLHIEDRPRRPQRTRTHPPDCGTGHGKVRPVKEPVRRRKRE